MWFALPITDSEWTAAPIGKVISRASLVAYSVDKKAPENGLGAFLLSFH